MKPMSEPLPREIFDAQLRAIVAEYGPQALLGQPGISARISVFAAEQGLEAVGPEDVRYRNGLTCEDEDAAAVEAWIRTGRAYYLSMNICRFNC